MPERDGNGEARNTEHGDFLVSSLSNLTSLNTTSTVGNWAPGGSHSIGKPAEMQRWKSIPTAALSVQAEELMLAKGGEKLLLQTQLRGR